MSISSITNLSASYLLQAVSSAFKKTGITAKTAVPGSDSGTLSPFAQLASTLQQLQQSDPAKFADVTSKISTVLQSAAQTAQSQGNSGAATQLTELAGDFTKASQSGQVPNLKDLAQAVGGGGHHHHSHGGKPVESPSTDADSGSTSSTSQFLSLLQANSGQSTQDPSLDPGAIIFKTLSDAGI
jgi:hypothetical protein